MARISISASYKALILTLALLPMGHAGGPEKADGALDPGQNLRRLYTAPLADWPAVARFSDQVPHQARDLARFVPASVDPTLVALGQGLFSDRRLSANGTIACADCHQPGYGLSQARPSVAGVGRHTPSLQGVTQRQIWGWDGRHQTLAAAIKAPLLHPAEMANPDLPTAVLRVQPFYAPEIAAAFGDTLLTPERLAQAFSAFLAAQDRPSRLDRFLDGAKAALSDQEIEGLHLFRTKARCILCHNGPNLSDDAFHNLGLSSFGEASEDLGRWQITGQSADVGAFRTPSLRGIASHAPYMHSGHFASLEGVVRFYMRGGGEVRAQSASQAARPLFAEAARLAPELRPFDLSEPEIAALVAFLGAL